MDVIKTIGIAGAAALPGLISILILVWELRHQRQFRKMNIEEEYLRKALEVLEIPLMSILDFSINLSAMHNDLKPGMPGYIVQFKQLSEKLSAQLDRFTIPIKVLINFANERKTRKPVTSDDFGNALVAASDSVQKLGYKAIELAKTDTQIDIMDNDYKQAEDSLEHAGVMIVRRIHEMYEKKKW